MAERRQGNERGRGRGRKKMRLLAEVIEEIDRVSSEEKIQYEFPAELLEIIMSRLALRDNIRASVVCKSWLNAAISVRNPNKPPLLMIFPKFGNSYEFYDPSLRKTFSLDLPKLEGSQICCSKDNWLLLYKPNSQSVFFFSPFTRELIELPDMDLTSRVVSFSAAPTSSNCILVSIKNVGLLISSLSTWRPGETEWNTVAYHNGLPFVTIWNKIVPCKGVFCCFSDNGVLGVYNTHTGKWVVTVMTLRSFPDSFFLAEYNGDIFATSTNSAEKPKINKLDVTNHVWSATETFEGMTFFVNHSSSCVRTDLHGKMRNKVYFPKIQFHGKHCISYSLDQGRYYPRNKLYDWAEEDLLESVWIEPPENYLSYFQ